MGIELFVSGRNAADDLLDEAQLVAFVEDAEICLVAEALRIAAKDPQAKRVKRRGGDKLRAVAIDHACDSLLHFARGLVGKCHGQNLRGILSLGDQPGDACRNRARLPRAGAGENQQWTSIVLDGLNLLRVQVEDSEAAHGNSPRANLPITSG